jgi:hypothetical protein
VFGNCQQDRGSSRVLTQGDAMLHDGAGKAGVIRLSNQLKSVGNLTNYHGMPAESTTPIER